MSERIHASYWLETPEDPQRAAQTIAGEQSSGTFLALANETDELKARSGARVERLTVLDNASTPSLPGKYKDGARFTRCQLELSWSTDNMGISLPNVLATVAGNLFELQCVSGLRITDLQLPPIFSTVYRGPAFGIAGTRRLAGVASGPLIGSIIKPSVGLSPELTALEARKLIDGGIDFIKDDELQAGGPHCPFEDRVRAVMHEVHAGADRLGRKVMVAFNLTGELDEMKRRHDFVHAQGGTCVMLSLNSVGLVGLHELRRHSVLPIHAHRNGWGYLSRHPALGWDYRAWHKLWRLAGADHLHVNGLANKFSETDAQVAESVRAVTEPLWSHAPMNVMPVFSSGQTGLVAAATHAAAGSQDLIFAAGGGIFGHPAGVADGVTALRQAWDAAVAGVPLQQHAAAHPELQQAVGFW
ncbi:MAG TPA: ribulose 1,5-bisphosphate carboxylase [Hydrogenophaga sp.]|uniref:ribulose-bisphosphate carboxylase large subunit family protein n=1 Tax=Hydrogenophaga sp. TaxID=1904254 RepID=UPI0008B262C4|nr:ribulose-bisphosphate carboxylase large subunit family protein [Hydrogenophaga sp.]OGA75521.1 MAG: ribulose 1,5-bisphosphate carboxylase [Burkholderiales bacterium GWE1_65_30]OGA93647.1 MAG: ribulose 1,5-bisphosphate carboxylase [Burkholderiales bacterium GWF1_66_17]HAX20253.1 ribulose 1,5-bisphosphate carboxylase [Hydrogenophaga sp.]HBU18589.1 ribulose 1,5-bisphosphate carboxylase [Hydrogenophaga sp.]